MSRASAGTTAGRRLAAAGAAAAILLVGCSAGDDAEPQPSESEGQTSPSVRDAAGYTEETRDNFVASCTREAVAVSAGELDDSDARALCDCFFRGVQQEVPYEDFVAADSSGQVPEDWQSITTACQQDVAAY